MVFKVGELVLYLCDERLPCVGMVAEVGKNTVMVMTMPSFNSFSAAPDKFYRIDHIKKLLNKG